MFVPERQRFGSQMWKRPVRVHQYLRDMRQKKYPQMTLEKEVARKVGDQGHVASSKQKEASDVTCC